MKKPSPKKTKKDTAPAIPKVIAASERYALKCEIAAARLKKDGKARLAKEELEYAKQWREPEQETPTGCYTMNELAELYDYRETLPPTWYAHALGAINALPAGRLLRLLPRYRLVGCLSADEEREKENRHLTEIGRVILEAIHGDDPATFFSQLAKWFDEQPRNRSALKLRDFGVNKRGRQKQRTDNDFLFPWAIGSLISDLEAQRRTRKITLTSILKRVKEFGGNISETEGYKRIREMKLTRFMDYGKRG